MGLRCRLKPSPAITAHMFHGLKLKRETIGSVDEEEEDLANSHAAGGNAK